MAGGEQHQIHHYFEEEEEETVEEARRKMAEYVAQAGPGGDVQINLHFASGRSVTVSPEVYLEALEKEKEMEKEKAKEMEKAGKKETSSYKKEAKEAGAKKDA